MPFGSLHRGKGNTRPERLIGRQGSSLQSQLELEGVSSNDMPCDKNRKLLKHVIDHKTPGYVTDIYWQHEVSTLQHEYILVSVTSPDTGTLSWLRVERMGNISGSVTSTDTRILSWLRVKQMGNIGDSGDADRERAGSLVTLAPLRESLLLENDKLIAHAQFKPSTLDLFDIAHFVDILDNEEPQYTLWYHNCWWFARQLFKSLVSEFVLEDKQRKELIRLCKKRGIRHPTKLIQLPSSLGFVVTAPLHHPVWPIVVVGAGAVFAVSKYALYKTEERVDAQVKKYMQERLRHDPHALDIEGVRYFLALLLLIYLSF